MDDSFVEGTHKHFNPRSCRCPSWDAPELSPQVQFYNPLPLNLALLIENQISPKGNSDFHIMKRANFIGWWVVVTVLLENDNIRVSGSPRYSE